MKTDLRGAKNIETDYLKISGNCMEFKDTVIQLSNISLFSTTDISAAPFPMLSIVVIILGFVLLKVSVFVALSVLVVGAAWIYSWYASVQKAREMKRLTIITNSGNAFPIVFDDKAFLSKVVDVLTRIVRNPETGGDVNINIRECSFSGSSHVISNLRDK